MHPHDIDFALLAHHDRVAALRRDAERHERPSRRRLRRRLGSWFITAGVRLAAEPPVRSARTAGPGEGRPSLAG